MSRSHTTRRRLLLPALAATVAPALWRRPRAQPEAGFSWEWLVGQASAKVAQPYEPPPDLPPELAGLSYDDYRQVRFMPHRAVPIPGSPWSLQFFHPGYLYAHPVRVHLLADGTSRLLPFDPASFSYDGRLQGQGGRFADLPGWAGFRLHRPRASDGVDEEFVVFLGGSYFRARAPIGPYGLSARGLAIDSGLDKPEEFPNFTAFWIGALGDGRPVVYALLESPSAVGAYRFEIGVSDATVIEVTADLFLRAAPQLVGIAPLTSMFEHGLYGRRAGTDFRPRIHDTDGLSILTRNGRRLWRPLDNPEHRRWSIFGLESPLGFGLFQRERSFATYADLEAQYHQRPNLWIEPREPWGMGSVRLLELPTPDEYADNIAAFWVPGEPFRAGEKRVFGYRMTWAQEEPVSHDIGLAKVERTLIGLTEETSASRWPSRRVVLDFSDRRPTLEGQPLAGQVTCHGARCSAPIIVANPETGGWRLSFDAVPTTDDAIELTAALTSFGSLASEVWHGRLDGL